MCGLIGYIGNNAVVDNLLSGLKNLEYRGYDSAGIAINDNSKILSLKAQGKLGNLMELSQSLNDKTPHLGIGHIRWATHGVPSLENAHPHFSNDEKIALVHNGIIENYKELKDMLIKNGYIFASQTDTETAVHLIDFEYKKTNDIKKAVFNAINQIKGTFAFCIIHNDYQDQIIATRKNAPLIIGLGSQENFIASDITALIGKVDKYINLDDGEVCVVCKNSVVVTNKDGDVCNKNIEKINFSEDDISKCGHKHFMLKEIYEQPAIIRQQLAEYIKDATTPVYIPDLNIDFRELDNITIVACGTSLHAAMYTKSLWEEWLNVPVNVESASEYIYKHNIINDKTLMIGISQSGETADTISAIKIGKEKNAKILILTNRLNSNIVRYANGVMPINAGVEVSVAATKSYSAQLFSLFCLGLYLAEERKFLSADEINEIKHQAFSVPAKMEQIFANSNKIKDVANIIKDYKACMYIARNMNVATAYEGALKLKEISYINANAYQAGELKHGPIALLDENMPVIAILGPDVTFGKVVSNIQEAKARGAMIVGVISDNMCYDADLFDYVLEVPYIHEKIFPVLANVSLQLVAYYIADFLCRDVDQPRNLAKSVTVE